MISLTGFGAMDEPDFWLPETKPIDRSKPLNDWFVDTEQYRAKVQRYSRLPPEVTVQRVSFERDRRAYQNAYERGHDTVYKRRGGPRTAPAVQDPEKLLQSRLRSKKTLRRLVLELAPNHFVTFTTREAGPEYLTPEDWRAMWARFIRLVAAAGYVFDFVAVLERHPSNPQHLHLHVAWRGRINYAHLHRFWHMAILGHRGVKVTKALRGSEAPGTFVDKPVKARHQSNERIFKIAKYLAKYLAKDMICEHNKKRYWTSKGLKAEPVEAFYLKALEGLDALTEAARLLGFWSADHGLLALSMFAPPGGRILWFRGDPDSPPF
jgi:hypothetical protein